MGLRAPRRFIGPLAGRGCSHQGTGLCEQLPAEARSDLARLLALVDDIEAMRRQIRPGERQHLRARSELRDRRHAAWIGIANAEDAIIALERLSEP